MLYPLVVLKKLMALGSLNGVMRYAKAYRILYVRMRSELKESQ